MHPLQPADNSQPGTDRLALRGLTMSPLARGLTMSRLAPRGLTMIPRGLTMTPRGLTVSPEPIRTYKNLPPATATAEGPSPAAQPAADGRGQPNVV